MLISIQELTAAASLPLRVQPERKGAGREEERGHRVSYLGLAQEVLQSRMGTSEYEKKTEMVFSPINP